MKIGKIVIGGVVLTVLDTIIGMVCCGGVFNWVYKLEPINVWKPMDKGPGIDFIIGTLILNIIFMYVYVLLKNGLQGKSILTKGLVYGLCVWAVGMLPGMLATYSFMTVATTVVIYWTILGLVKTPLSGAVAALIYGK